MKRIICLVGGLALLGAGCARSSPVSPVSNTVAVNPSSEQLSDPAPLQAPLAEKGIFVPKTPSADEPDIYPFRTGDELNAFMQLVGPKYVSLFAERFQTVSRQDEIVPAPARTYEGAVPGLYTIMEGIIVVESPTKMWAAVIDGDAVRYFSTVSEDAQRLPQSIETWRERFKEKSVVYMSAR